MTERVERVLQEHHRRFDGKTPTRVFRAPGRVNLIGEHTDYNDGFVMPVGIDRDVLVCAALSGNRMIRLHALDFDATVCLDLDRLSATASDAGWGRYLYGVVSVLQAEGIDLTGLDGVVQGNVPIGAGLSSSAALEVALAVMLTALAAAPVPGPRLARWCQRAENEYAGVQCGIMDQFISCLAAPGAALFLDCRSLAYEHIPFDAADCALVVANTNRPRGLVDSEYNQRRAECEEGVRLLRERIPGITALRDVTPEQFDAFRSRLPERVATRCSHVIHENDRVLQSVEAMKRGDMERLGALMNASHDSLRDLYEVSCRELDLLVAIARDCDGVLGSRMTGAGFGGCTVSLVKKDAASRLEEAIRSRYPGQSGYEPDVYLFEPSGGAGEAR
jgi:galactokinase